MRRFSGFTLISGTGWMIDVGLTVLLVSVGLGAFWASVAGSLVAVTFVFVVSQLMVFETGGRVKTEQYWLYLIWHGLTIPVASGIVAGLTALLADPAAGLLAVLPEWISAALPGSTALAAGIAKIAITPATLTANFFFMRWLVERRGLR